MATYLELKTQIARTVGDERYARFRIELVGDLINQGYKELAMITRNYNTVASFPVTAPGPTNLPPSFISMNRILLGENPLWKIDYRQIRQYKNSTATLPSFYVVKNNQLQLYPLPEADLTLTLDYTAVPPPLSADSDTPHQSLGHHADQFLRMYASRELSIIGQDFEAAQHFAGQLGILEMKTRESISSDDSYELVQVYSDQEMVHDAYSTTRMVE
jgi:hypothetical protein